MSGEGGSHEHPLAPRQLVLALDHAISFAREDFLPGPSNAQARALIDRWPDWPDRLVALIGPEGSGKSHLAAIWAGTAGARVLSAKHLSDADVPGALATGALVVEDLEPGGFDERALFHLINLAPLGLLDTTAQTDDLRVLQGRLATHEDRPRMVRDHRTEECRIADRRLRADQRKRSSKYHDRADQKGRIGRL